MSGMKCCGAERQRQREAENVRRTDEEWVRKRQQDLARAVETANPPAWVATLTAPDREGWEHRAEIIEPPEPIDHCTGCVELDKDLVEANRVAEVYRNDAIRARNAEVVATHRLEEVVGLANQHAATVLEQVAENEKLRSRLADHAKSDAGYESAIQGYRNQIARLQKDVLKLEALSKDLTQRVKDLDPKPLKVRMVLEQRVKRLTAALERISVVYSTETHAHQLAVSALKEDT